MNTDVMILADVFESFRKTSLEKYKLDPAHITTAPGLSWAACLRKTKVRLELMTDPDIPIYTNMSLLGGVIGVFEPLPFANNPKMGEKYDSSKPLLTLVYADACNLYGCAMRLFLPTGGFVWVEVSSIRDWADFILKQGD